MHAFLAGNPEMCKLLQRQALVDVHGFSLQHETSLAGVFGVRRGLVCCISNGARKQLRRLQAAAL